MKGRMEIKTQFDLKEKVWIKDLEQYGQVRFIEISVMGLRYDIQYWLSGKREFAYFWEDELDVKLSPTMNM